jgi:hypothetical protein
MQPIILLLTKSCNKVDKYEAIDTAGNVIKKDPPVGPTYFDKRIFGGAKKITLAASILEK